MNSKKSGKRAKRKGGYIQIYEEVLNSEAYRDLTVRARCLLVEFYRVFRPTRNGQLSISLVNAAELLGANKNTVGRAFYELEEHGFIALTKGELWQGGQAREWRLTTERWNGREPSDEWRNWRKFRSQELGKDCPRKQDRSGDSGRSVATSSVMQNAALK